MQGLCAALDTSKEAGYNSSTPQRGVQATCRLDKASCPEGPLHVKHMHFRGSVQQHHRSAGKATLILPAMARLEPMISWSRAD